MRSPVLSQLALSRRKRSFGLGTTLVGAAASTIAEAGRAKPTSLQWSFAPVPMVSVAPPYPGKRRPQWPHWRRGRLTLVLR
jgi:hypothetical protein